MRFLSAIAACALGLLVGLGMPVSAQDSGITLTPELDLDENFGNVETVEQPKATAAPGAILRGLDKVGGTLSDIEIVKGQTVKFGRLNVTLGDCRFPSGNPSGDAYAYLVIRSDTAERPIFEGWMIASSPALNALDHPRYDLWVIRCKTS